MIRSIYTKIFLWFWLAMTMVTAAVVLITVASGSQPLGRRWLSHSLDLYARSAVDFYTHGGKPALQRYLDDIQSSSGVEATLIAPDGEDILGRGIPRGARRVYERARNSGSSRFLVRWIWTGASVVPTESGTYYLVARVYPVAGMFPEPSFGAGLLKVLIAVFSAGILSWLLARHFAGPIRGLQSAAGRIADGDLSVRAVPLLPRRNDEIAELARDFDRMADRVQGLLQKQQELLADISHELRSPLTRMSVSLELARRGETDALERMQTEIDTLDTLIGQILTLTRLQGQQSRKLETPANLKKILEGVVQDAQFEGKAAEKTVSLDAPDECRLHGDPALLRSAFENVVRNAVRYTRPGSRVDVSLRMRSTGTGRQATILVEDSGDGVPATALPRLFEPFYRISESRERATGGTGLGLSIAQKVVQLHGGSISARNREAGGLAVEIILPETESTDKP